MFKFIRRFILGAIALMMFTHGASAQETATSEQPVLMAAGSLTQAMNAMTDAYAAQGGARFIAQYGPSGKLRREIEAGKKADVFASASTDHTDALASQHLLGEPRVFTHNDLCVVARPELGLTDGNLLGLLSRGDVRLATSTPVTDPMGDYTWQFFRLADRKQPGLYQAFDAKALKLSGASAPPPGALPPYVTAFTEDRADAYIMYCTNAVSTRKSLPHLAVVRIPQDLNVRSEYGIAAGPHSEEGRRFVEFVLSPAGQEILKRYGFR